MLGSMFVMLGVGFVLASKDPARYRIIVQVGIIGYALPLLMTIYYLLRGIIGWNIATGPFIIQLVFMVALVVLYPKKLAD